MTEACSREAPERHPLLAEACTEDLVEEVYLHAEKDSTEGKNKLKSPEPKGFRRRKQPEWPNPDGG